MELKSLFKGVYANQTVLVTGHTGFKGSWLTYWLKQLGANVIGYSSTIPTTPNHFQLLGLKEEITHIIGDVRMEEELKNVFKRHQPILVFHLAAQSLVRYSYQEPLETFSTNLMGTTNVLECCRINASVKGIVNVTSDKCYENFEDDRPYKETDQMGGYDPYSASKGGAELIANAYRSSFFNPKEYDKTHTMILSSARAGNVIGGGDWSKDRLIPDLIKKANKQEITSIRSPHALRPWQHVLEPLSGYLLLGQQILEKNELVSDSWNFGPLNNEALSVGEVVKLASIVWNKIQYEFNIPKHAPHEAKLLRLDCSKANQELKWFPVWNAKETVAKTIQWYETYIEHQKITTKQQLAAYVDTAYKQKQIWAT